MDDFKEKQLGEIQVKIDRLTCIASKNCIHAAPDYFELDEEQIVTFCSPLPDGVEKDKEKIIEACSVCPVSALIVSKEGEQIIP